MADLLAVWVEEGGLLEWGGQGVTGAHGARVGGEAPCPAWGMGAGWQGAGPCP